MVKCPWCGNEVSVDEYCTHLDHCKGYSTVSLLRRDPKPEVGRVSPCELLVSRVKEHLRSIRDELPRAREHLKELEETLRRIGLVDPKEIRERKLRAIEPHRENIRIFHHLLSEDLKLAELMHCDNLPEIRRIHDIDVRTEETLFEGWIASVI
jgi:hypothetical protein